MGQHEFSGLFGERPTLAEDLMAVLRERMKRGMVSDITIAEEMIADLRTYHEVATRARDRGRAEWERMDNGGVISLDDTLAMLRRGDAARPSGN